MSCTISENNTFDKIQCASRIRVPIETRGLGVRRCVYNLQFQQLSSVERGKDPSFSTARFILRVDLGMVRLNNRLQLITC